MRAAALICVLAPLIGCASDETFIIVTVDNRPAVHDASSLKVSLSNAGTTRMDDLPLGAKSFPVTFSISAPGRTGELGIQVDAVDANGLLVGRGTATTALATDAATVTLDSADFVVNTEVAEDQFPSDDFEAHGFQLAAATDGTWTAAYRDSCSVPCNMFGRRFDATGKPVSTRLAASTNGFQLTTSLTTFLSTPAIATAGNTTLAVWDFHDPNTTATGVACRALDPLGNATPDQVVLATDAGTDVVSIAPLSNNNFMVSWYAPIMTTVIRTAIVKPDCTVLGAISTASTAASAHREAVAASGSPSKVMIAWIVDGDARIRIADNTNAYLTVDSLFVPKTANDRVEYVRVAPIPSGFAVAVRWAPIVQTGTGKIEVYRTNPMGMVIGAPVLITDKAGADFGSAQAFGVTARPDGSVLVVWHACMDNGDGSGCGVFGRLLRPDGTPSGEAFNLATTTKNDQTNPSAVALPDGFAVAWKDNSTAEPDHSGSSVRARIIYPN
jgi:hypothetical protein